MLREGPRDHSHWVTVGCVSSRGLAEVARSTLESRGIPVQISTDDAGGQHPELAVLSGIGILVPSTELLAAQQLLSDIEIPADELPWQEPPTDRDDGAIV